MKKFLLLGLAALASFGMAQGAIIGKCEVTGQKGQFKINPVTAGQLSVQTNLPGPGFWNGDSPATIQDGFEYCLAANIAHRLGLSKVVVQNVAWDAMIAGQTRNFDFALSQITITEPRKRVVDFSVPYFSSDIGVLARKGSDLTAANIKTKRLGVQQATTAAKFLTDRLRHPNNLTRVFPDVAAGFTALRAGQIDAFVIDTSIVLSEAGKSGGELVVVGQYRTGDNYGALFAKGSPNRATIDRVIEALRQDGTITRLTKTYLSAAWGADPTAVPFWQP